MGLDIPEGSTTPEETARLIRKYRLRRWLWFFVFVIFMVIISGTTTWVRDAFGWPFVIHNEIQPADVIIVLGAGTRKDGDHLPLQAKQRVLEGVKLFNEHDAPRIMMSGGRDESTQQVESTNMKAFALQQNIPDTAVVTEEQSTDTYQNAKFSLDIMRQNNWASAIVVTSPYHTWRACRIFHSQHANVTCQPAPWTIFPASSFYDRLMDTKSVIREYGAIIYNWVKGQL